MSSEELNRMLKKILSLVFSYDTITRVEEESTSRSETSTETGGGSTPRSQVFDGRMVSSGDEVQIPDPWDDPLM